MATQVNITSINGTPPFNIWVCYDCGENSTSTFIATTSSSSYSFTLPLGYENVPSYCVKVYDYFECEQCTCL